MGKKLNLIGKKFGRLSVLSEGTRTAAGKVKWLCQCDCGNTKEIVGAKLVSGHTQSCGCLHTESVKELCKANRTHHESRTRLYKIWSLMVYRGTNKNSEHYKIYGEAGIGVCSEWLDFLTFKNWALSNGYKDKLTIDRIDNSKGYSPSNCRWATRQTQTRNRRLMQLTEYSVGFIKLYLQNTKMQQKEIANLFGVAPYVISKINRGVTWADVKPVTESN